jgi:ribosomal protein L7/L12
MFRGGVVDEDRLIRRINELEQRLDWLYQATGNAAAIPAKPFGVSATVLALVKQGNKIGAIKEYRDETGCDLRTAKDIIDAL